jgi:hypothetical protein
MERMRNELQPDLQETGIYKNPERILAGWATIGGDTGEFITKYNSQSRGFF